MKIEKFMDLEKIVRPGSPDEYVYKEKGKKIFEFYLEKKEHLFVYGEKPKEYLSLDGVGLFRAFVQDLEKYSSKFINTLINLAKEHKVDYVDVKFDRGLLELPHNLGKDAMENLKKAIPEDVDYEFRGIAAQWLILKLINQET